MGALGWWDFVMTRPRHPVWRHRTDVSRTLGENSWGGGGGTFNPLHVLQTHGSETCTDVVRSQTYITAVHPKSSSGLSTPRDVVIVSQLLLRSDWSKHICCRPNVIQTSEPVTKDLERHPKTSTNIFIKIIYFK